MPYHGVRPCSVCSKRKYSFVKDCGVTGIIKCVGCGKEKRVKWSLYVNQSRFEDTS